MHPISKTDIPKSPTERALWVQMQLKLRGSSFAAIARKHGWAKTTVAMAMRTPSYRQEAAIAQALGVTVDTLFPERFGSDGRRLHAIRKGKHSTGQPGDNVYPEAAQ